MINNCINLFFPRRCPFCHEIITERDCTICPDCRQFVYKYYLIQEPVCKCCGKALTRMEVEYCMDCVRHKRSFDRGISLFHYGKRNLQPVPGKLPGYEKHSMSESIHRFKYNNCRDYADYYIEELLEIYGEILQQIHPDVIIPVPIHGQKMRTRGYNQAEILARKLGNALDIEVCTDFLVRIKKTRPQKELNPLERMRNLSEAFAIGKALPNKYRSAILIDDIYTTGSTMEICCRKLKEAGLQYVYCISICSGQVPDAE